MKRAFLVVLVCGSAGCSNAPIAGFMDHFFPSPAIRRPEPQPGGAFPPPDRIPPTELGPPVGVTPDVGPDPGVIVPGGDGGL